MDSLYGSFLIFLENLYYLFSKWWSICAWLLDVNIYYFLVYSVMHMPV
jgi:hypothetical protein